MADATSTAALKKLSPAQRLKLRLGALLRRKHHCRQCGGIFCDKCSGEYIPIPTFGYTTDAEQRVCLPCFGSLCNQLTHGSTAAQNARLNQKLNIMYLPSSGRGSGAPTGGRYSNVQGHQLPSGVISRTGSVDSGFYAHTLNGTGRESVTSTIGGLHGETESRFNFPPRYSSSHIFYHQQSTTSSMAGPQATYYPQGSVIVHHGDLATVENSFASHLHPTPNNVHRSMALPPAERPPSTQPTENEEDGYYTSGLTPRGHAQHRRSCGDYLPPRPTFLAAPNNKACDAADDLHNAYSAQDPGAQSRSILQAAIQNSQRVEGSNGDNYVPFATYPYQQQQQFVDDSYYGEEEDEEDFNEEGEEEQDEGSEYYDDGEEDEEYYDDEEDYDDDDYTTSSTSGSDLMAPPIPTHELLMAAQPPLNGGGNLSGGVSQNTSFALTGRVTDGDIDFEDDGDLDGGSSGASASRHLKNHSSGNFYAQLSPASTGVAGVIHNHRQQHHHHSRSASMNSPGKPRGVSVMGINGSVVTAGAYRLPGSAEPFNDTTTSTPSAARTHHQEGSKSLVLTGDYVRALQTGAIRSTSSSQPRRGSRRRHPSLSPVIRCATPQHRQGSSTLATPMQSTSRNGSIQLHGAIVAAQEAQTESSSSSSCGSLGTPKMALEGFELAFEPNNDQPSQMNNVQAAEMQDSFSDSESDDDEGALCTPVYLKQIALQQTLLSQQPSDVLPPIKAPLPSFKQQHIDGHHNVKSPFTTNQVDDSLATHNLHTSIPMSLRTVSATTADTTASIITQVNIPKNDDGGACDCIGYTCNVITVLLYPASGREQALVCTVSPMETLFDLAQRIVENYLKLIFNPFKPRPSEEMLNQTIRRHLRFLLTPALHAVPIDSDKAKKLRVFDVIALHDRVVLTAAPVASEEPPTASGIRQSNAPLLAAEVDALREFLDGAVSHPLANNSEPPMVPASSGRRSRTNSRRAASFMAGSECPFTTTQQGGFYDGTTSV